MDQQDLAYLRTVAAVIGQEIEKLAFVEQDLSGARLYACRTAQEDLNAVHTSLKTFINDRTAPGTLLDPVTHLAIATKVELTPEEWAQFDDTGNEEDEEDVEPDFHPDGGFGYYPSDDARPRGRHQVDGFS